MRLRSAAAAGALALLALASPARAASVQVTTTADRDSGQCAAGDCSLREAVRYAPSQSSVEVPAGTYKLTLGALRIERPGTRLDVSGPAAGDVAGGAHPTAVVEQTKAGARVFELAAADQDVALRNLRVTGGSVTKDSASYGKANSAASGGGIGSLGSLTLDRVEVDHNTATGASGASPGGGGVANFGSLVVQRSRIHDNRATSTADNYPPHGGGLYVFSGSATVQRSSVDANSATGNFPSGGGLYVTYGGLLLEGTAVSGNDATSTAGGASGGGLEVQSGGLLVRRSSVTQNRADASATLYTASGGGMQVAPVVMTVESSTIAGNQAAGGEAAGQSFGSRGGGIAIPDAPPVHLVNVTLTGNSVTGNAAATGGNLDIGFPQSSTSPVVFRGSIVAGGSAPAAGTGSCHGVVLSEGFNVVDGTGPCGMSTATRDKVGVAPGLGPLQHNGALTFSRAPAAGSPALDAGPPEGCLDVEDNPLKADQRYQPRAAICDAGAVDDGTAGASTAPAAPPAVHVTTTADRADAGACKAGDCTLREALAHASSGSTVVVPGGTYDLSQGELAVDRLAALRIAGAGAASTLIEQPNGAGRVLRVGPKASVALQAATLRGGKAPDGGGILVDGLLHLRDGVVKENTAVGSDQTPSEGGGIAANGLLYVQTSVVEANRVIGKAGALASIGGGIFAQGPVSVQRSLVARNEVQAPGGQIAVGGGIGSFLAGGLLLDGTGIEGNRAVGVDGGSALGGGVGAFASFLPAPPVLARRSLLAGNEASASGGGGASGGGLSATFPSAVTLDAVTITGNGAASGGGVAVDGGAPAVAMSSVIADNRAAGGGDAALGSSTGTPALVVGQSVISGGGGDPCSGGTVVSRGHSLVDAAAGECGVGSGAGDITGVDPLLGPLTDNGGPTRTRQPLAGSPLIGAGGGTCLDAFGNPLALDARGFAVASECDIGAYDTSTPPKPGVNSGPATGARPDGQVEPERTPTPTPTPTPPAGPGPGPTGGGTTVPPPPGGGGGTVPPPASKPKAADVIKLPSSKRCFKRRKGLRIRLVRPAGDTIAKATAKLGRKKAKRLKGSALKKNTLKRLPRRGKVKLRVEVKLGSGAKLTRSRTYRICR